MLVKRSVMGMYYEEKKKNKEKIILYILMTVIITLLLVLILRTESSQPVAKTEYVAEKTNWGENLESEIEKNGDEKSSFDIENSINAIVGISKLKQTGGSVFLSQAEQKLGLGSGVVITENGYILTNQHVSGNKYSSCYVTLSDGRTYDGNVVWADENIDLAIVKIMREGLDYLELGDSDKIELAEDVYAIGNPLGFEFERSITKGIISAKNRTIKLEEKEKNVYMEDLIQTDATINEGNSGGALIDESGKLIGINSVKISNAESIGFAVPINVIKPIINRLISDGKFEEAWLGIYGFDKEAIPYLNSELTIENGIYVAQIAVESPLAKMDIKEGDIITQIDETKINKMNDLKKYIYTKAPGDTVVLKIQRGMQEKELEVKLAGKS